MAEVTDDDGRVREVRPAAAVSHPLHLVLGSFMFAYFLAALIFDYGYSRSGNIQWTNFASWMIFAGLVSGGLSLVVGIVEWFVRRREPVQPAGMAWHGILTLVAMALGIVDAFVHQRDGWTSVVPQGIILSAVVVILLVVGSWLPAFLSHRPREVRA
ncbi:DUF2231 domain-containing protein [Sphingomonas ginkgonis]|uniref:DUF2231 domain-containing protein n=1 Tax=Sphingomonas ginkgonis TaxID=2315330 RepID=A0A429VC49_9SPHN|nr:DUF2231 domain-containing protein [Sphingomonas ginkgonis]RST31471.1 DUF2231 domain-containing protein [Sphingomonas ginkgonis]